MSVGPPRGGLDPNRLFVNAVLYVLKTGVPWADLPERFGNSNSIWRRFARRTTASEFERGEVGTIVADTAYDSDAIRKRGKQLKAKVCIKPNPSRNEKKRYDKVVYRHRNQIERFFGRIKRCRRIATRYEKKAVNFAGFI